VPFLKRNDEGGIMGRYVLAPTVLRILIVVVIAALACLFVIDYFVFDVSQVIFNAAKEILFLMIMILGAIDGPKIFKLKR
jgi:hypothetical protein